jgi:DNA-binding response OmpR family regulator
MRKILIVTRQKNKFSELVKALETENKCQTVWAGSFQTALASLAESPPDVVILDEILDGVTGLEMAKKIVLTNALINIAVVSRLSDEDFHEAGEGLGILAHLPPDPGRPEAEMLLTLLSNISVITTN